MSLCKPRRKSTCRVAVLAAMVVAASACSSSGTSHSAKNNSSGSPAAPAASGVSSQDNYANYQSALTALAAVDVNNAKSKKSGSVTIDSLWQGPINGWGSVYQASMTYEAKKFSNLKSLKWTSNGGSATQEITQLQNAVNTKPDAIVIEAMDMGALQAPIAAAESQGIPVVTCIDGVLGNNYTSWVGVNLYQEAFDAANHLAEDLNGKGGVAMFNGIAGNAAAVIWAQGAKAAFAKYPGISVVDTFFDNWSIPTARQQGANLIAAHPDVAGIFAGGTEGAVGAIEAYAAAGKAMPVFGVTNVLNGFLRLAKQYNIKFYAVPESPSESLYCLDQAMKVLDGTTVKQFYDATSELPGAGAGYDQTQVDKWYVPQLNDNFIPPLTAPLSAYEAVGLGK